MYSGDSTTTLDEFVEAFTTSKLAMVAITDHNRIDAGFLLQERLGQKIISGQEVRVKEGELIGLYLKEKIQTGLDLAQAAKAIRRQGALVYVPHPGDSTRASISKDTLFQAIDQGYIDIVETANSKIKNGTALTSHDTEKIAGMGIAIVASSDAHVPEALGSSYTNLDHLPMGAQSLLELLHGSKSVFRYCDPPRVWQNRVVPSFY